MKNKPVNEYFARFTEKFKPTFTLCTQCRLRNNLGAYINNWRCTSGFSSIQEANEFALANKNRRCLTKIYIRNFLTPLFCHRWYIRLDMVPHITFLVSRPKSNVKN